MDRQTVLHTINYYFRKAQLNDKDFEPHRYKWKLGQYIVNEIRSMFVLTDNGWDDTCVKLLYDIPVEIDVVDPTAIELWKKVSED